MLFTDAELEFLQGTSHARLATVSPSGQPDVVPVGYAFDGEGFTVQGVMMERTIKYANVQRGNERFALVADDRENVQDGPRGVKVHGRATIIDGNEGALLRLVPQRKWSWGVNGPAFQNGQFVTDRASVEQT